MSFKTFEYSEIGIRGSITLDPTSVIDISITRDTGTFKYTFLTITYKGDTESIREIKFVDIDTAEKLRDEILSSINEVI